VFAFYARPTGVPIRATKDVDCMSKVLPSVLQEQMLAQLCALEKLIARLLQSMAMSACPLASRSRGG
jgi:hypothetical protein